MGGRTDKWGETGSRGETGQSAVRGQSGQGTIEWVGLVLTVSLALGATVSFAPRMDGRSFGGFLAHRLLCAARGGCPDGLARDYGERDAALLRDFAPNLVYEPGERQLPVDFRRCRRPACANAPDQRGLDVHRSHTGERATAFTHVMRRRGRTYLQYWLYYPDSNTVIGGSDTAWNGLRLVPQLRRLLSGVPYPGFHRDDWEAYVVRLDPDGRAWVRASSHGHWQGCKSYDCEGEWMERTGWTRVSRGSHAGHIPVRTDVRRDPPTHPRSIPPATDPVIVRRHFPLLPGRDLNERTTTGEGLRLVALERRDVRRRYRPGDGKIAPPWKKPAYRRPESGAP